MNNNIINFWKKSLLTVFLVLLNFSILTISFAQTPPPIIPSGTNQAVLLPHNTSAESNSNYLNNRLLPGIASTIIALTGGLSLMFMIIAGIFLLTSYGNPERAGAAKKTITYAVAGIIISGLSYGIVAIIASIRLSS